MTFNIKTPMMILLLCLAAAVLLLTGRAHADDSPVCDDLCQRATACAIASTDDDAHFTPREEAVLRRCLTRKGIIFFIHDEIVRQVREGIESRNPEETSR